MSIRKEFDKWCDRTPIMRFYTAFNDGYLAGLEVAAKVCDEKAKKFTEEAGGYITQEDAYAIDSAKECSAAIRALKEIK